jgi:hypothetical protein
MSSRSCFISILSIYELNVCYAIKIVPAFVNYTYENVDECYDSFMNCDNIKVELREI